MSRTNFDGKPIRRVLSWLTNQDLTDADLAAAIDMPTTTFSRRKDEDNFPSFEELTTLADHFGLDRRALLIDFGYADLDDLVLLDETGMKQYLEQGGGNHPHPTMPIVRSRIGQALAGEDWGVTREAWIATIAQPKKASTAGLLTKEALSRALINPPL